MGAGVAAALVFGVGVGAQWLKGKAQTFVGEEQKIEALKERANKVPFTRPADGAVTEDRLLEFLEVRKRVFSVYEKHRADFEALKNKKDADFSDIKAAFGVLGEARLAVAQAMADVGMGEEEYRFMVQAVYQSAWAAAVEKSSGKPPSEAMGEMMRQAQEAMKKGVEAARNEGVPGVKDIPDDAVQGARRPDVEGGRGHEVARRAPGQRGALQKARGRDPEVRHARPRVHRPVAFNTPRIRSAARAAPERSGTGGNGAARTLARAPARRPSRTSSFVT